MIETVKEVQDTESPILDNTSPTSVGPGKMSAALPPVTTPLSAPGMASVSAKLHVLCFPCRSASVHTESPCRMFNSSRTPPTHPMAKGNDAATLATVPMTPILVATVETACGGSNLTLAS